MMSHTAVTLAIRATVLLAAGPALADMTVQFRNDSPIAVEWWAGGQNRTLAPSAQDSLAPTRDPVLIEVKAQNLTICSATALVTEAPAPLTSSTCSIDVRTFHAVIGVTCNPVTTNTGGKDCSVGLTMVPVP